MNLCDEPMPSSCKVHVVVELKYPHIIGFSGYERHHDVATCSPDFSGGTGTQSEDVHQSCQSCEPNCDCQTQGKQWRSKGRPPIKARPLIREPPNREPPIKVLRV